MHTLGISMYAKWKEEMQKYEGKSQKEMTAQLKAELVPLEGKIHAFMAKDMLKLLHEGLKAEGKAMKEACKQEVSTAMENEIKKSKEAIAALEASVSKVQENVEKKVHTWAEMAKDAVDKEAAMYDTQDEMLRELDPCDLDMHRMAQDAGDVTEYGMHFLALGSAHGLLIYNGLSRWPGSDALTCWNPKGGSSTVDYLM
ncbi:hypothetical protein L7F22_062150 [Adiantum nelumboides]|nr:hypothetical protein [Adiantum nelumboides]